MPHRIATTIRIRIATAYGQVREVGVSGLTKVLRMQ